MAEDNVTIDFDGERLAGVLRSPDSEADAVALLLHGGPGGSKEGPSDLYVRLANSLAAAGIASARFDFFGANESGGDYAKTSASHQVAQYRQMVSLLRAHGFTRLAVVGESFGGTCALGGYCPAEVDALVLLWPAIWLLDTALAPFLHARVVHARVVTPERQAEVHEQGCVDIEGTAVGAAFIEDILANPDREKELASVIAPTLIIHGDADREVPVHQSERAFELLEEPKRLVVVPGAEHCLRRPDEQALAISETTDWLTSHLL